MTLCRHCCRTEANRPRGLCWHCYYTPGVRDLYPSTSKFAPRYLPDPVTVPPAEQATPAQPGTAEKLAILEQRACAMVELWHADDEPMDRESLPHHTNGRKAKRPLAYTNNAAFRWQMMRDAERQSGNHGERRS